jgi:hypothetical protein
LSAGEIGIVPSGRKVDFEPSQREVHRLIHGNRICGLPRIETKVVCKRI